VLYRCVSERYLALVEKKATNMPFLSSGECYLHMRRRDLRQKSLDNSFELRGRIIVNNHFPAFTLRLNGDSSA
jgi:hypothetical protein